MPRRCRPKATLPLAELAEQYEGGESSFLRYDGGFCGSLTASLTLCICAIQFGKQLAAQQVPVWASFYLDYKGLKKV